MSTTAPTPTEVNVEDYLPLAKMLAEQAHRGQPAGTAFDELESDALYALAQAARAYDPSRGVTFRTYAANCIRHALWAGMRQRRDRRAISLDATCDEDRPRAELIESREAAPGQTLEVRDQIEHMLKHLKPRQRAVAQGLLRGLTKSQIAEELGVAPSAISRVMDQIRRVATELGLEHA